MADKLHSNHANLIVGRVDCTKDGAICEKYEVQSYPTIIYLNNNARVVYKGDRSVQSLVDFAERLNSPDFKQVKNCNELIQKTDQHGLIVLSAGANEDSELNQQFKKLASSMKQHFWFYRLQDKCKSVISGDGIYLLKRHLNRSIKFQPNSTDSSNDLAELTQWLVHNSFPVYSPLNAMNFDRIVSLGKLIVIAVLDEYKPAKQFSQPSRDFHRQFEKLAREYAQIDDKLLFVWSSDLDLIQSIAIGNVLVPNIMLLKNKDLSHHILIRDREGSGKEENELPLKLRENNIRALIDLAKNDKLSYEGGVPYVHAILRFIFTQFNKFFNMYRASPLLASILIGLPAVIIVFVIYTTCFYDSQVTGEEREDEEEYTDDEESHLLNHAKQD